MIIANIERQFLVKSGLSDIQFYFGKNRIDKNNMISYFKTQAELAIAIASLVLLFHFVERVLPGFALPLSDLDPSRSLPYLAALGSVIVYGMLANDRRKSYENLKRNSPGIDIDTSGVVFGPGHDVD